MIPLGSPSVPNYSLLFSVPVPFEVFLLRQMYLRTVYLHVNSSFFYFKGLLTLNWKRYDLEQMNG